MVAPALSGRPSAHDGDAAFEKGEGKQAAAESAQCSPDRPVEKAPSRSSKQSKPRGRPEQRKAGSS